MTLHLLQTALKIV